MTFFLNLKIAHKLLLSFLIILALTVVLGITSIVQLGKINEAADDLGTNWLPSVQSAMIWKNAMQTTRRRQLLRIMAVDEVSANKYEKQLADNFGEAKKAQADYEANISEAAEKTLYADVSGQWAGFEAENGKILTLLHDGKGDEAKQLATVKSTELFNKMMDELDQIVKINSDGSAASTKFAHDTYGSARNWVVGILLACIVAGLALAWLVAGLISRPLQSAAAVAARVAAGDLTADIQVTSRDETGQLMQALYDMNLSLRTIVGQVRSGTDTIATASAEIAAGNQDLSSRTEEQASSLEETAATMEELTTTVRQNAENARQANQMARSTADVAQQGGALVSQVVGTMQSINDSSRKIADIIGVIDGIAFQTNILALNAAVEAARAGEQGRGFAVVATEVRNLAHRSATAAKEIKQLIGDSVGKVDQGSRLVGEAGATMEQIVSSVQGVCDIIGSISTASDEQRDGIDQVNVAIGQMDQVTQQNAALVEQAAAAAESLQEQAGSLKDVVGLFRTGAIDSASVNDPRAAMGAKRPRLMLA